MIEEALLHFPGRVFVWTHPATLADPDAALGLALRRLDALLVPTAIRFELVDADDDRDYQPTFRALCTEDVAELSEVAVPTPVARLDAATIAAQVAAWATEGKVIAHASLVRARYRAPLPDGTELRIRDHGAVVVNHGWLPPLLPTLPTEPPLTFQFGSDSGGRLSVAVHWSSWYRPDGFAAPGLRALIDGLAADGWTLTTAPDDWSPTRRPEVTPAAPRSSASASTRGPVPTATTTWCALPATTVRLGLTIAERDRLARALVEIEAADRAAEASLGMDGFDRERRRTEIVDGLALATGEQAVVVAGCEIQRHPVTNAMWQDFMRATGAARPAGWGPRDPAPDEFVTGISVDEAHRFAAHHGWTLPTEAEWQLAATGGDARWFPWGDPFAPLGERLRRDPVPWPVGRAPALASPLGVEDLLGAFCEYTADPLRAWPGGGASAPTDQRVARGIAPRVPTCIAARRGVAAEHRFKLARFRCVRR